MKLPQPFWAVLLAFLGTIIALACLYAPSPQNIILAVLAVASNLVSGALGAFAGHASATNTISGPDATINSPAQPPTEAK